MIEIVGLLLDAIDLSHLEALPGPSCVSTALQLKRKRSLWARFAEANGNYHNISNTWLVRGFPSSSPLTPATQSGLYQPGPTSERGLALLSWPPRAVRTATKGPGDGRGENAHRGAARPTLNHILRVLPCGGEGRLCVSSCSIARYQLLTLPQ
jgi:hypothetical protein